MISKICNFHLAPTSEAKQNLLDEGIKEKNILVSGNTVIDALFLTLENLSDNSLEEKGAISKLNELIAKDWRKKSISSLQVIKENFGEGFKNICLSINQLASSYPNVNFIYPVHLNPKVSVPVNELLGSAKNIYLIPPLNYQLFTFLLEIALQFLLIAEEYRRKHQA